MNGWVAIPIWDRGPLVQARLSVARADLDRINSIDWMAWRMAAYGGTPGEFSANVETFAVARGLRVPERSDTEYVPWKQDELGLWRAYTDAGCAEVIDGDWADTSQRARVYVVGFADINGPMIDLVEHRTNRTNARSHAFGRAKETNSERGKVYRENRRRVRDGLHEMSRSERESFVDELRANEAERTRTNANERTDLPGQPNQTEDIGADAAIVPTERFLKAAEHDRQIEADEKYLPAHLKTGGDREAWRAEFPEAATPLHDTEHGDTPPTNTPPSATVATLGDAPSTPDDGSQPREAVTADTAA